MSISKVFTDGGSRGNPGNAGLGGVIYNLEEETLFEDIKTKSVVHEFSKFIGVATNNDAEYLAFLQALEWVKENQEKYQKADFYSDSKLVVEQVNKKWKVKDEKIRKYVKKAWQLLEDVSIPITISHVRREKNKEADALVNQALDSNI